MESVLAWLGGEGGAVWVTMFLGGVLTWLLRGAFFVWGRPGALTPGAPGEGMRGWSRLLAFVPVAALSALVVPDLLGGGASGNGPDSWFQAGPRLYAGVGAIAVAALTRRTLPTFVAGFLLLWLFA